MDVTTRWDSTGHMMIRALRLRQAIDIFCSDYTDAKIFALSDLEWKQIGYLVDIVRPFNFFTTTVGKTKSVTLPYGLAIYDELFERLMESRRRLKAKEHKYLWVTVLIEGIDAAQAKLDHYYNKTYTDLGSFYGIGAILNPNSKLTAFDPDYCWLNPNIKNWQDEFEDQFRELYRRDYSHYSSDSTHLKHLREVNMDPLALMLDRSRYKRSAVLQPVAASEGGDEQGTWNEIDQWLATSKF